MIPTSIVEPVPAVSVIVPTFNRADWLASTVASALAQTRRPLEVIIVDDGSTDGTEVAVRQLAGPVRFSRQANAGVGAARNTGAREARGEVLAFLDCEDLWEAEKLEVQLALLAAHPEVGWCLTGCTVIDLENHPVSGPQGWYRVFSPFRGTGRSPEAFFGEDLQRTAVTAASRQWDAFTGDAFRLLCFGNFGLPSSAVVRRDLFESTGGFNPSWRLAEETEFFHRLAAVSPVGIVVDPLVRYRVGQTGTLTSPANTITLLQNALASLEGARNLRAVLRPSEEMAFRTGRHRLLEKLAYAALSNYDSLAAREALATLRTEAGLSHRAIFLSALSVLPASALRLLHWLKRVAA